MSNNNFDETLTSLQNVQDNAKLLKLLIDVRKKIDSTCPKNKDNITRLRETGAFKQIVLALQTSKKGIINTSLSILGNCCLDSKCAADVISQYGILSNLNQLLKRFSQEDSINGRVFRIVGNLCQHRDQWASVIIDKKPQIVIHTVQYLKNSVDDQEGKVSDATVVMGVRSLRELLSRETLEMLVKTYGVLKTVGMLLIKYGTVWQETKKSEGVVMNIIKLLHEYSRYRYHHSILEMRNTDKGDSIAYLSKILLIAPLQVVKIVMNFLKISHLKSDLPVPEIFDSFVQALRDKSITQEFNSTCEEYLKCICHLLDHPGNRENERCGESIPLLISVLKDLTLENTKKIECCLVIISTLNKCKYNNSLIAKQIKCDIVTVLNEKLKMIVGSVQPLNVTHKSDKERTTNFLAKFRDTKRMRFSDECCSECKIDSSSSSDDEIDQFFSGIRYDHSPSSSNDSDMGMSWTSGLSPRASPQSQGCDISESDSDDYSPVCSEVDPTDLVVPIDDEDIRIPELDSKNSNVRDDSEESLNFDLDCSLKKQLRIKLIMEMVDLLKTYTKVKPAVTQLGTPDLLLGLIKSSGYFDWPHSSALGEIVDVISKILNSHDYLLPLMMTDFIPAVYDLNNIQHGLWCSKCRQFRWIGCSIIKKISKIAESGGGKGEIAHTLLRGENSLKQQLVLIIPYVVRKPILVKLMLKCGGLEILMKLLQEQSHTQYKSIKALCVLASRKLSIPNPRTVSSSYKLAIGKDWKPSSSPIIVTFKLDDGSLLEADRELLSRNSDFFARLLNGDFKESSQDVITLPNVSNNSLTYLLDFIKCDTDKTDLIDIDVDLITHLDVIGLCDRFLMEECRMYLTDCVERFRLSSCNIPTIYNWSLESRTNLLRVECIAFALVGNMVDAERFEMFKKLFQLGYTDELVEDIRHLLVRYMTVDQVCECKKKRVRYCDTKFHLLK